MARALFQCFVGANVRNQTDLALMKNKNVGSAGLRSSRFQRRNQFLPGHAAPFPP